MRPNELTHEQIGKQYHDEAHKLLEDASERGMTLRLLGSQAIREHCPKYRHLLDALKREYVDLDFVALSKDRPKLKLLMREAGYEVDRELLIAAEGTRYLFYGRANGLTVDVFIDELAFCHRIDLRKILDLDYPTIPLTELFLSKMQIVEMAQKDMKDVIVLLLEHEPLSDRVQETISIERISQLLAQDWGFYYTVSTNLAKIVDYNYQILSASEARTVADRVGRLSSGIEATPKTLRWKLRSLVGTKVLWYKPVSSREPIFR